MTKENITAIAVVRRNLENAMETLSRIAGEEAADDTPRNVAHSLNMAHDYIGEGVKLVNFILRKA